MLYAARGVFVCKKMLETYDSQGRTPLPKSEICSEVKRVPEQLPLFEFRAAGIGRFGGPILVNKPVLVGIERAAA